MISDTKKQLCKDGYESTEMVLVKIPDRNRKVHFVVVSDMAEAKKVFSSDYDKRIVQVWNIKTADKHYFTVSSDIGDRDEYICESFEEAREYLSTVIGWGGEGCGSITEIDKHLHCVRSWHYSQNKETSHYDFSDIYNKQEEN